MKKKYYLFKMNMKTLNIFSIFLMLLSLAIFLLIYREESFSVFKSVYEPFILIYIPYLVLHELLHSLAYVIYGAKFKNITYGVHIEKGVLCCLCKENINKRNILHSLLYPFAIIGVISLVVGIIINNPLLILLSLANISGCSGDLIMFYHLSKLNNFEYSEYDDPTSFGIYTNQDLSKKKMIGLDYVGRKDKLDRNDFRKVTISRSSIIIIISFYILILISIYL